MSMRSAADLGLAGCDACGLVAVSSGTAQTEYCPRCSAGISRRKPHSSTRCWALLTGAYILYLPANLLPIIVTRSLYGTTEHTIMGGIASLWKSGSWEIAAIVFTASMVVPIFKLIALTMLLISVRARISWRPRKRTRLYRLLRLVGHWSMLDIYVVAIVAKLLQFRLAASAQVGPAALYFGAVVILTMLAANEFDPRLIWDSLRRENPGHE